ncbi:hypothetical protein GCM10009619_15490 [Williamsia maris]
MTDQRVPAGGDASDEYHCSASDDDDPRPTDADIHEALLAPYNGSTVIDEIVRVLGGLVEVGAERRASHPA